MSLKIALIDPPGWQKGIVNVGLLYMAACIESKGFDLTVIDANNNALSDDKIINLISEKDPNIIGLTVNTGTVVSSIRLSNKIKKIFPDALLVAGGPHVTLFYEDFMMNNTQFDYCFIKEAEVSFIDFCEKIDKNEAVNNIPGLLYIDDNKKIVLNSIDCYPDPKDLPFPSYDSFYPNRAELLKEKYPLVTSRGCPYSCIFCTAKMICGKKWRARDPENIIEELNLMKDKYSIKRFEIVDDNFTLDLGRAKSFCKLLISENLNLTWSCPNGIRADRIDRELASIMKESGCDAVSLGIESAAPEVFKRIHKGEKLEDIEKAIVLLKEFGINVTGLFIIGLPGDNAKNVNKTLKFIKKTKLDQAWFGYLIPFKGTEVYKWAKENARILLEFDEMTFFGSEARPMCETDDFTAEEMVKCYEKACTTVRDFGRIIPKNLSEYERARMRQIFLWKYDKIEVLKHPFKFCFILLSNEKVWNSRRSCMNRIKSKRNKR